MKAQKIPGMRAAKSMGPQREMIRQERGKRQNPIRLAALTAALTLGAGWVAGQTESQDLTWVGTSSGTFNDAQRWLPATRPTSSKVVHFNTGAAHTVYLTDDTFVDGVMVQNDQLTLDLGGYTLTALNTAGYGLVVGANAQDTAEATITNGTFSVQAADVGRVGTVGTLTIGAGGVLDMRSVGQYALLSVGAGGTGTLVVQGGGGVHLGTENPYGLHIGGDPRLGAAGTGTVVVTGTGSTLDMPTADLFAGSYYTGGSGYFTVSDGASAATANAWVGYYDATTGSATVTGAGSTWTVNGGVFVGGEHPNLNQVNSPAGQGMLQVQSGGTLTAGSVSVGSPGDGTGTFNISGGSASVAGTLTVYNGTGNAVNLSGGSLAVGGLDTQSNPSHFHWTGGNLTINSTGGVMVGAGGPLGASVLVPAASTLGSSGGVMVASGGSLGGSGTVAGLVTLASGGHLAPGSGVGTFTVGALSLSPGGLLDFDLGTTSDRVNILNSGSLTLNGGTINISQTSGFGLGTYTLLDYAGSFSGNLSNLAIGNAPTGYAYSLVNNLGNTSIDLLVSAVTGGNSSWAVDASGTWGVSTNWVGGVVPNSTGAAATFGPIITADRTVTLATNETVGSLVFNSAHSYTLEGDASMTLAASSGSATVSVLNGNHVINLPVLLSSPTTFAISSGSLTLSGFLGAGSDAPMTKTGAGTLSLPEETQLYETDLTVTAGVLNAPYLLVSGSTMTQTGGSITGSGVTLNSGSDGAVLPTLVLGPAAGSASYVMDGAGTVVGNIPAPVSLNLFGDTLSDLDWTLPASFTNAGNLLVTDYPNEEFPTLTLNTGNAGTLTNTGNMDVEASSSSVVIPGNFVNSASGVVTIGSETHMRGNVTNAGAMSVASNGYLEIDLNASGVFNQTGGTLVTNDAVNVIGGTFNYTGGSVIGNVSLNQYFNQLNQTSVIPNLNIVTSTGTGSFNFQSNGIVTGNISPGMTVVAEDGDVSTPASMTNAGVFEVGGSLSIGSNGTGTITNSGTLLVSEALQGSLVNTSTGTANLSGSVNNLTNAGTVNIAEFATVDVAGTFTQSAGVTKVSDYGTLQVEGPLNLSGGSILLTSYYTPARLITSGINYTGTSSPALIDTTGFIVDGQPGEIDFQGSSFPINVADGSAVNDLTINASIVGDGPIIKTGAGTLALGGYNGGIAGGVILQQGTLSISNDQSLGASDEPLTLAGGVLTISQSLAISRPVTVSNATINVPNGLTLTMQGAWSGSGPLNKIGSGILEMDSSASGLTVTTISAGTLRTGATDALGNVQTVTLSPGGILDTDGYSQTLSALTGNGAVYLSFGNTLTLGNNDASSSFSGNISGQGSLAKIGAGVVTLSGNDAYSGGTILSGGTLKLGSDAALPQTTTVTSALGSTLDLAGRSPTIDALAGGGSVINSSGTLSTLHLLPGSGDNNTFSGGISGPVAVSLEGYGAQTLSGGNSFTGGVSVSGGTLALTSTSNSFTGGIVVSGAAGQIGTLAVGSDGALGSAANAITLSGGRLQATGSFATSRNLSITGSGSAIDVPASGVTLTYSGALSGGGSLAKTGPGTLLMTSGASGYSAPISLTGGTLRLAGPSGALGSSAFTLGVGTMLQLDNASSGNNNNRLSDSANVVLNGGTFSYLGADNTASSESLGQLIAQSGGSTVSLVNGSSGTTAMTFSALGAGGAGATVNFQAGNIGSTNKVLFSAAPQVIAGDPVAGNLGSWATVNGTDWAKYSAASGVIPFAASDYSSDQLTSDTHALLTATPANPIGNLSLRTLNLSANGAGALNLSQNAGTTLTLSQGGLLHSGPQSSTISGGVLASGSGELDVYSSGGDLRLSGVIADGSGATDFVKAGPGTVYLGGGAGDFAANTFTGITRVEGGTLVLDKAQGTYAVPGGLEVSGGTLVVNRPGQINPNAPVSLSGGTFNLNGQTESFDTFTNSGGLMLFNGGTLTVNSFTLTGGTTIVASELTAGSFKIINSSDNEIHAGGSVTVTGTTTFSGDSSPGLTIYAGATPGKLVLGGNFTFDGSAGTASILTTTPTSGQTAGIVDLGSASRTFNINDGADAVDMRISAVIQSGSLVKSGAGTLRLEGANTYTGGTTLSAGTLEVADPKALGTGPVTFSSTATLLLRSDSSSVTFNNPITVSSSTKDISLDIERNTIGTTGTFTTSSLTLGKSLTLSGSTGGTLLIPGAVSLQANVTLNNSVALDLEGAVSGGFAITKTLGGTLTYGGSSANSYSGLTTVNAGILQLSKSSGVAAIPGNLTINGPSTIRLMNNDQIADSSAITLNAAKGTALLDLNGYNETVNTLSFVAGGTVQTNGGTLNIDGDVTFTGAAGSGLISGYLNMAGSGPRHFNVADGLATNDLEISAAISGTQGLVKEGAGRLLLDGVNYFTGGITVNAGSIYVTNDSAISSNSITLAGGTLISSGSLSAPVSVSSASAVDTPDSLTLTGLVSGSAGVTKTGTGTLTLMGDSSLTGPLSITGGVLAIPNSDALGLPSAINLSGATFRATSSVSTAQPVTASVAGATFDVPSGATLSLTGGLSGSGAITKTGAGTLAFGGTAVSTTGLTNLSQGSINFNTPQTLPGGLILASGTTLNVNANSTLASAFTSSGGGILNHGANVLTFSGTGNTSLSGKLRITGSSGGSVVFARTGGSASVAAGSSVQIDAGATLQLSGSASVFTATNPLALNNDSVFLVSAGTNTIAGLTGAGSTSVSGGTLSATVLRQTGLSITGGSVVVRPAASSNTPASTSLFTSFSIAGTGKLDLGNSAMAYNYPSGGSSPAATIRLDLLSGRNGGAWNGPGIDSASAAADSLHARALGYVEASDLLGLSGNATTTWNGVSVDATTILVEYTYAGDANLDGKISSDDYALLDRGAAKGLATWSFGDFNYDGVVNSADYLLIDTTYALQSGGSLSPSLLAQREAQFGQAYVSTLLSSVPEPSMLGAVMLAAIPARRRRRH